MNIKKLLLSAVFAAACLFALCICAGADSITDELVPIIKEGAANRSEYIDVSAISKKYGWTKEQTVDNVGLAYLCCPELFYVSNKYSVYYSSDGKYFASFSYIMSRTAAEKAKAQLDAAAKEAVAGLTKNMSDVEKALYVHDYLILHCKYDYDYNGYDAYSCLVTGKAVCQGYSLAYMYILREYLGIDCTVVYSNSTKHAWNYVRIGDNWYHVDLTGDDPSSTYKDYSYDNYGFVSHENFLVSDALCRKLSGQHSGWQIIGGYPAASSTIYDNAFWRLSTAQICPDGRKCYYTYAEKEKDKNGKRASYICSYDFSTGKYAKLLSIKVKWYSRRGVNSDGSEKLTDYGRTSYVASWLKLAKIGNNLYFNTNKRVYRYDITTKTFKQIYELNKEENQIFGLNVNGKNLRLAYRLDITYPENYLSLVFA